MKKIILGITIFAFAASSIFLACKKSEDKTSSSTVKSNKSTNSMYRQINGLNINVLTSIDSITSHPNLQSIVATNYVSNDLITENLSIYPNSIVETHIDSVTGNKIYTMALQSTVTTTHAALIIQPLSEFHNIYNVYIVKRSSVGDTTTFIKVIGETGFTPIDMVGDAHWRGCMVASWNSMTSNMSGVVTCALAPEVCVAACLISCANAISTSECVNPTKSKADALACLCALNIIDCSKYIAESGITFTSPL